MALSVCHVVFSRSAAAVLRDALGQAGRDERVVSLSDCLNFGPINPPDPRLRIQWVEKELGYTGWEEVTSKAMSFWSEALSANIHKVAWVTRRSTLEYAGFLEWLWRCGDEIIEIVDLTDVIVAQGRKSSNERLSGSALSLGLLPAHIILENNLFDCAEPLSSQRRALYREQWKRLKAENAPLRILSEGELVSAPISFFDLLLLSCATSEWKRMARIVGEVLVEDISVLQIGDLFLFARARALVAAGRLESRGDLSDIQKSELRLPDRFIPAEAD